MAGIITHIYLAEKLVEDKIITVKDMKAYLLGCIAPDAIMAKEDYHRDDKKNSHLRNGISSDDWYLNEHKTIFKKRIQSFYQKYVQTKCDDFALGYLIHLLTDQVFHYSFRLDIIDILKSKGMPNTGKELFTAMVHELDTLDHKLLNNKPSMLESIGSAKEVCGNHKIDEVIDEETLCRNFNWIIAKYQTKETMQYEFKHYDVKKIDTLINQVVREIEDVLKLLDE